MNISKITLLSNVFGLQVKHYSVIKSYASGGRLIKISEYSICLCEVLDLIKRRPRLGGGGVINADRLWERKRVGRTDDDRLIARCFR